MKEEIFIRFNILIDFQTISQYIAATSLELDSMSKHFFIEICFMEKLKLFQEWPNLIQIHGKNIQTCMQSKTHKIYFFMLFVAF